MVLETGGVLFYEVPRKHSASSSALTPWENNEAAVNKR